MNTEIKALLVDDHLILREGVKKLLESSGGIRVVASAGSAEEAWAKMDNRTLDVVITDLQLPDRSGLWLVEKVAEERPETKVLVLSISDFSDDVLGALKAGASGYLTKTASLEELEAAVKNVCSGGSYLQPKIASLVVGALQNPPERDRADDLTPRAKELLRCLVDGLSNKAIAEKLIVSVSTVKTQLRSLFLKFGVSSRTELVVAALNGKVLDEREQHLKMPHRRSNAIAVY